MQTTAFDKLESPPRTAIEVFELLPEGTLAEVINNVLYMSPAPNFNHQELLGNLYTDLNIFIRQHTLGKCVVSPVDVYLGNDSAVQPDIIFIATDNVGIVKDGKVKGVPDLIVEVLSGNKKHDLQTKKVLYEAFGVKEYHIINQDNKNIFTYYFDGNKFILQESRKGKLKSKLLRKTFSF